MRRRSASWSANGTPVEAANEPTLLLALALFEDGELGEVTLATDVEAGHKSALRLSERGEVVGEDELVARAGENQLVGEERVALVAVGELELLLEVFEHERVKLVLDVLGAERAGCAPRSA